MSKEFGMILVRMVTGWDDRHEDFSRAHPLREDGLHDTAPPTETCRPALNPGVPHPRRRGPFPAPAWPKAK